MRPSRARHAEPEREHAGVDAARRSELSRLHPQDLADQQIAQMLAAVHIAREQQHAAGRGEHEHDADDRLLHVGPAALGPRQQQRAGERGGECGDLHRDAPGVETEAIGEDDAAAGDLRDREVDEHDAAREHLRAERHVRRGHEQAGERARAAGSTKSMPL